MPIDPHIPLPALRAFEASARHLSFSRAADELFVTQAAVSHQIRRLEDFLGVRLFRRLNRAVMLTDEGQALFGPVHNAFNGVDAAVRQVRGGLDSKRLTVSSLPSVASRWLVPRLGSFMEAYPDIDLRLAPNHDLTDFERDDVDVVVRYGRGRYPGLHVEWLFDEDLYPMCSPRLIGRFGNLDSPADLARYPLLHDDNRIDWTSWLRLVGADEVDPARGPVFNDSSMLIQAAVAGQGIALARSVLAEDDLEAGRLVRLFEQALPAELAYYLVYPPEHGQRPTVQAFRSWVLEQRQRR